MAVSQPLLPRTWTALPLRKPWLLFHSYPRPARSGFCRGWGWATGPAAALLPLRSEVYQAAQTGGVCKTLPRRASPPKMLWEEGHTLTAMS